MSKKKTAAEAFGGEPAEESEPEVRASSKAEPTHRCSNCGHTEMEPIPTEPTFVEQPAGEA